MNHPPVKTTVNTHFSRSLRVVELIALTWAIVFIYLFAANATTTAPFLQISLGATGLWAATYTTRTKVV